MKAFNSEIASTANDNKRLYSFLLFASDARSYSLSLSVALVVVSQNGHFILAVRNLLAHKKTPNRMQFKWTHYKIIMRSKNELKAIYGIRLTYSQSG